MSEPMPATAWESSHGEGSALRRFTGALEAAGCGPVRRGKCRCPAHDDHTPSLSVQEGDQGVVLHCFAGCPPEAIVEKLGLKMADLFDRPREGAYQPGQQERERKQGQPKRVASYVYTDRYAEPLRRKVRIEPGFGGKRKSFLWEKATDDESWTKCEKGEGNPHVLYRLPEILEAEEVHWCEGEKAVDVLVRHGIFATCMPADEKEIPDTYTEPLRGKSVLIWQDRDEPGEKKAARAYLSLRDVAESVRVVRSRTDGEHDDAFDHLAAGYPIAEAQEVDPRHLPGVDGDAAKTALQERFADDATRVDVWFDATGAILPALPRRYLVTDLIPEKVAALLSARGGTGKGFLELALALCLPLGVSFGRFSISRPRGVLLVSREDDRGEIHRRFESTVRAWFPGGLNLYQRTLLHGHLRVVDLFGVRGARLGDVLVQSIIEGTRLLEDPGLILLDPLGKLLPEGSEALNTQEGAGLVHEWLDVLVQETSCTTIAAHHVNKETAKQGRPTAGSSTGSLMLEDLARVVLTLHQVTEENASKFALPPSRYGYVQAQLTKANYSPGLGEPFIFEKKQGGALYPAQALNPNDLEDERVLRAIEAHRAPVDRDEWRNICKQLEPELGKNKADEARTRLSRKGLIVAEEEAREGSRGRGKTLFRPSDTAHLRDRARFNEALR